MKRHRETLEKNLTNWPEACSIWKCCTEIGSQETAESRCKRIHFEPWSILAAGGGENSRKLQKPLFIYLFIYLFFAFNFIQFFSLEATPPFLTWAPVLSWSTSAVLVNAMVLFIKHFRKTQRQIVGKRFKRWRFLKMLVCWIPKQLLQNICCRCIFFQV